MRQTSTARARPLPLRAAARAAALVLAAAAFGCGERARGTDSALARDLAMARGDTTRDLDLAPANTSAPELHDVALGAPAPTGAPPAAARAAPPAPPRPRPSPLPAGSSVDRARVPAAGAPTAPAPAAPAPVTAAPSPAPASMPHASPGPSAGAAAGLRGGTVSSGTVLRLEPHIRVCTNVNSVGDVFEATLGAAVTGPDGATVPAGANAVLRVTGLSRQGEDAVLSFELMAVGTTGQSFAVTPTDAGGAVAGSARTGTALARGAGPASAEQVARFGTCVPRGGELVVTLTRGVRVGG